MVDRYNTGNPVPSNTMKDLSDNALTFDDFINKPSGMTVSRSGKNIPVLLDLMKTLSFTDTGTVNSVVISGITLTAGNIITVSDIVATNTGPATITINGGEPVPITAMGGAVLQGNELVAGGEIVLVITETGATLNATTAGNLPVAPGTASGHAATIGQLTAIDEATLKTGNNFSEIAAAGPAAQAAAKGNLGITDDGGDSAGALKIVNNLSEIAEAGMEAQAAARENLGITTAAGALLVENNLSEIAAAGTEAQAAARENIGAPANNVVLKIGNNFSEIAAAGIDAQVAARENIGATDGTGLLTTSKNLSEIKDAGPAAQAAARDNLDIQPADGVLLAVNNLSEIAAAGPTAQAAAQANLGITGGGDNEGGAGQLLGTMLITTSGTYNLLAGTNTIYAEICAGGGGGQYAFATTALQRAYGLPGISSDSFLVSFSKSALSTASENTIIITIGGGGAGEATSSSSVLPAGGATIIDNSSFISLAGAPQLLVGTGFRSVENISSPTSVILSYRVIVNQQGVANQKLVNEITTTGSVNVLRRKNAGALNAANICVGFGPSVTSNYILMPKPMCFFEYGQYGMGGSEFSVGASYPGTVGSPGTAGAVMLFMYS